MLSLFVVLCGSFLPFRCEQQKTHDTVANIYWWALFVLLFFLNVPRIFSTAGKKCKENNFWFVRAIVLSPRNGMKHQAAAEINKIREEDSSSAFFSFRCYIFLLLCKLAFGLRCKTIEFCFPHISLTKHFPFYFFPDFALFSAQCIWLFLFFSKFIAPSSQFRSINMNNEN